MTTASYNTRIRHDTDVLFREWGQEFSTKLAAVGMVQTTDTGQINWTTVVRPGAGVTDAGYEIWRFADAMQATAPIFIRFDYGNGSAVASPRLRMTVGTGSDGAGNITGLISPVQNVFNGSGATNVDTVRQSYMCHTAGAFWVSSKNAAVAAYHGWCGVFRTCDGSGVPDGVGAMVVRHSGGGNFLTNSQALRFASPAQVFSAQLNVSQTALCQNWQGPTGSVLPSGDTQVHVCWTITPRAQPIPGIVGVHLAECAEGTTFSIAPVSGVSHTYICMNSTDMISANSTTTAVALSPAGIWE